MAPPFDLTGGVALVTGGNGGIGLGIASALAVAGASVVLAARDIEKTAAAVDGLRRAGAKALGVACDVTSDDDRRNTVEAARSAFGAVTILVNNSGISRRGAAHELLLEDFDAVQDTNVRAPLALAQLVYPDMVAAGGGKIINVASGYSFFGGAGSLAYSTSKGALLQLTRSLANAWAKDNIQVNAICPGYIQTALTAGIADAPALYDLLIGRIPAARPGQPDDLGGAAVFLASAASAYVTGIALPVDGGMLVADVAVRYPL